MASFQVGNQLKRLTDVLSKVGQPKDGAEQKQGADDDKAAKTPAAKQKKRKDVSSKLEHQDLGPQNPTKTKKKQKGVSVAP